MKPSMASRRGQIALTLICVLMEATPRQVVEDFGDLHLRAWEALAAEEGKSVPPRWMLRRAEGMKNEQARC